MAMNRKILRRKEGEITKAGRMFFDAVFGDTKEFVRKAREELEQEETRGDAITVEADSFVRCEGCAREQVVPADMDARALEGRGWRLRNGAWRCPFCARG
jgi:hypothetical protein